jgi:hypothetical protein
MFFGWWDTSTSKWQPSSKEAAGVFLSIEVEVLHKDAFSTAPATLRNA